MAGLALALLTGAGLFLGAQAERSHGISEPGVPLGVVLRAAPEGWRGEAAWSSADKDQGQGTPCCWRAALSLDREAGPLIVGAAWTHRDAEGWTKDRAWLRGGVRWRGVRLVLRSALSSRDRESDAEVSVALRAGRLSLEPAYGWTLFDQGAAVTTRRWASHLGIRALVALGGAR